MKTVFCAGSSGESLGGVDWYYTRANAENRYAYFAIDPAYAKDDVVFFSLKVPDEADVDEITRLADLAAYEGADENMTRLLFRPAAKTHIDKFGREWNFDHSYDTGNMLQVDLKLLDRFLRLDWKAKGVLKPDDDVMPWDKYTKLDAYLFKRGSLWYAGVRYGDEPHQYFSPYFSNEVMDLMILSRTPCDHREHDAWVELVGRFS